MAFLHHALTPAVPLEYDTIHAGARFNDPKLVRDLVSEDASKVDKRDDWGFTSLHLAAKHGSYEVVVVLLQAGASLTVQDIESGWTSLHTAFYFKNVRIALLLIQAGAQMGDENYSGWGSKEEAILSEGGLRDHEGFTPLDLLSSTLQNFLPESPLCSSSSSGGANRLKHSFLSQTTVSSFGKSDFPLGIPLPNAKSHVHDATQIESLSDGCGEERRVAPDGMNKNRYIHGSDASIAAMTQEFTEKRRVVQIDAAKYHSVALTDAGRCYSWGHGKGGRLGLGNENTMPTPHIISFLPPEGLVDAAKGKLKEKEKEKEKSEEQGREGVPSTIRGLGPPVRVISISENHCLAATRAGNLYAWGQNSFGQLGIGSTKGGLSGLSGNVMSPQQVTLGGLKRHFVIGVSAGETHSVCFTDTGYVFSFGSNSKGQLGLGRSSRNGGKSDTCSIPTLVSLPGDGNLTTGAHDSSPARPRVLQVSAGARSTLLLREKAVPASASRSSISSGHSSSSYRMAQDMKLNLSLTEVIEWGHGNPSPTRVVFQPPSDGSGSVKSSNTDAYAYRKKKGNTSGSSSSSGSPQTHTTNSNSHVYQYSGGIHACPTRRAIGICQVSAGKAHNVALSSAGHVYSWGLGVAMLGHQREECQPYSSPALSRTLTRSRGDSEGGDNYISVGIGTGTGATNSSTTADPAPSSTTPTKTSSSSGSSSSSHYLSTPQLVEALLPERGGALVRQVRASSDRTCAVTACGDMYTWGDTISQGVLGLGGGSSYSPVPRKVRGIKRSILVATGGEHSLVLSSHSVPPYPCDDLRLLPGELPSRGNNKNKSKSEKSNSNKSKNRGSMEFGIPEGSDEEEEKKGHFQYSDTGSDSGSDQVRSNDSDDSDDSDGNSSSGGEEEESLHLEVATYRSLHAAHARHTSKRQSHSVRHSIALFRERTSEFSQQMRQTQLVAETEVDVAYSSPPSLKALCARSIARLAVNSRTAAQALCLANQTDSPDLASYCEEYVMRNLDSALCAGGRRVRQSAMLDLLAAYEVNPEDSCVVERPKCTLPADRGQRRTSPICHSPAANENEIEGYSRTQAQAQNNPNDLNNSGSIGTTTTTSASEYKRLSQMGVSALPEVSRRLRAIKKTLSRLESLETHPADPASKFTSAEETHETLTQEQREKLSRKPALLLEQERFSRLKSRLEEEEGTLAQEAERQEQVRSEREVKRGQDKLKALGMGGGGVRKPMEKSAAEKEKGIEKNEITKTSTSAAKEVKPKSGPKSVKKEISFPLPAGSRIINKKIPLAQFLAQSNHSQQSSLTGNTDNKNTPSFDQWSQVAKSLTGPSLSTIGSGGRSVLSPPQLVSVASSSSPSTTPTLSRENSTNSTSTSSASGVLSIGAIAIKGKGKGKGPNLDRLPTGQKPQLESPASNVKGAWGRPAPPTPASAPLNLGTSLGKKNLILFPKKGQEKNLASADVEKDASSSSSTLSSSSASAASSLLQIQQEEKEVRDKSTIQTFQSDSAWYVERTERMRADSLDAINRDIVLGREKEENERMVKSMLEQEKKEKKEKEKEKEIKRKKEEEMREQRKGGKSRGGKDKDKDKGKEKEKEKEKSNNNGKNQGKNNNSKDKSAKVAVPQSAAPTAPVATATLSAGASEWKPPS